MKITPYPSTMHAKDSLQIVTDTLQPLASDSLAILDSATLADSLLHPIVKTVVVLPPRGYVGIPIPSSPVNEHWVFGVITVLFLFLVISHSRSTNLLSNTLRTFFQVKDRSSIFSKTTISDFRYQFFMMLFSIGVFSLTAYLFYYDGASEFSFVSYLKYVALTSLFFLIKIALLNIVGYVFTDTRNQKLVKEGYFDVMLMLGITLFPVMIVHVYAKSPLTTITEIGSQVLLTIAFVLLVIKLFQIFLQELAASFYILLYLCTLEILPLIALFLAYRSL